MRIHCLPSVVFTAVATWMTLSGGPAHAQPTRSASSATRPAPPPPGEGGDGATYGLGGCPGDSCGAPIVVDPSTIANDPTLAFDNSCATSEPADAFGCVTTNEKTIWYQLTPPFTGRIRVSTCGGLSFNCYVSVYVGPCNGPLQVICSDDYCGQQSEIEWAVAANVTYLMMVNGRSGQSGSGSLRLSSFVDAIANDEPVTFSGDISTPTIPGPMVVPPDGPFPFVVTETNIDLATPAFPGEPGGPNDPIQDCTNGGPSPNARTVWFSWTPRTSTTATVRTCGSNYDTVLSVYSGTTATPIVCNDDAGSGPCVGPQSLATWSATGGTTYLMEVTQRGSVSGVPTLILRLDRMTSNSPPNMPGRPTGSRYAFRGRPARLNAVTTDPDGDSILYLFDWGDGATTASGVVPSGTSVRLTHLYANDGFYQVRVSAMDTRGESSASSDPKSLEVLDPVCRAGNVNLDAGGVAIPVLFATDSNGAMTYGTGPGRALTVHRTQPLDVFLTPAPAGPEFANARYLVFGWRAAPTPDSDTNLDLGAGRMCMNPYSLRCGSICPSYAATRLQYSCRQVLCPGPESLGAELRSRGELVRVMSIPPNTFAAGEIVFLQGIIRDLSDTSVTRYSVTNALGVIVID